MRCTPLPRAPHLAGVMLALLAACGPTHVPWTDLTSSGHGSASDGAAVAPADVGPRPDLPDGAWSPASAPDLPHGTTYTLEFPAEGLPGRPFPVAVTADAPVTAELSLLAGDRAWPVRLYRGRGSLTLHPGAGPLSLGVGATHHDLVVAARPVRALEAVSLDGEDLAWGPEADIHLTGRALVPAGRILHLAAGTRVLLAPAAGLEVAGGLVAEGTAEAPVLFLPAADAPWGGITVPAGEARFTHTWLTGGGGDRARAWGHSGSQPVIFVDAGELEMDGGGLVDNPGKALGSRRSRVTLRGVLVSRCDTGGEHSESVVTVEGAHFLEMPDADGEARDDDNDGIYVQGRAEPSRISDTVFAVGEDDAIDHNGADLAIERVWIEGFRHEGIAASTGGIVSVSHVVVRHCQQGIEAGQGAPTVEVDRCLITQNAVGLRWGDEYAQRSTGRLTVTATVALDNTHNVQFTDDQQGEAPEDSVSIACSMVDDPDWDDRAGNRAGRPSPGADACTFAAPSPDVACGPLGPEGCP